MVDMASSFQIQSDHFEEFFAPELDKHGYQALYKRKTNEVHDEFLCIMIVASEILYVINPLILLTFCRFTLVISIQLMVVQHFFAGIDFHMSKNMR